MDGLFNPFVDVCVKTHQTNRERVKAPTGEQGDKSKPKNILDEFAQTAAQPGGRKPNGATPVSRRKFGSRSDALSTGTPMTLDMNL